MLFGPGDVFGSLEADLCVVEEKLLREHQHTSGVGA